MSDTDRMHALLLDLERSQRTSEAMVRCLHVLAVGKEPAQLFDALPQELQPLLDADGACLLIQDPDRSDAMQTVARCGNAPDAGAWPRQGILSQLGPAKPTVAVDDVGRLPEWEGRCRGGAIVSAIHISVGTEERPTIIICTSRTPGHFDARRTALADVLAPIAAQSIARAEEHRRLLVEIAERTRIEAELRASQTSLVHLRKMEAISQLAGGLAHEINTPLQYVSDNLRFIATSFNGINNIIPTLAAWLRPHMDPQILHQFLEAVDYEYLAKELPRSLEHCQSGLERVGTIVHSLKMFAQHQDGPLSPADLNEAVGTTIEVCRGEVEAQAEIATNLSDLPQIPCRIGEIRQILLNLLLNAAQAIADRDQGRGRIEVSTRIAGEMVEIEVADDGCGMDSELLRRAGDAFFTTRPVGQGLGQGLAIAHQVAHQHGGSLELHSLPGYGTSAVIRLPLSLPSTGA